MRVRKDITGQRFGRLVVLGRIEGKHWRARCDCGSEITVDRGNIVNGHTQSCGCWRKAQASAAHLKHGGALRPDRRDSLYGTWVNMNSRCYAPQRHNFKYYGGRGISVCDRWRDDFAAFKADVGAKPTAKHTLDRIDADGPYSPENCRWALPAVQRVNRSKRGEVQ